MDNVHCNIIQDLLPLYADDVVSPQSREMVENHLRGCESCRAFLAGIREEIPVPVRGEDAVLKKLHAKQLRKRILSAVLAALWVALILGWPLLQYYTASLYDQEAVHGPDAFVVSENEDGQTELLLTDEAFGARMRYLYELNGDGTTDLYVYLVGHDPVPKWLWMLLDFRFIGEELFPVWEIGPQYSFDSGEYRYGYSYLGGIRPDETVVNVWYLPITEQMQEDFYYHYLTVGYLNGYEIPDKSDRQLIWSAGE